MPIALRDVENWFDIEIPGSDRSARMHVLHSDPATGASVSMVRFPPGWSRPEVGHYTPAEEFVVLEGTLTVGAPFTTGDYVYLPPRTVRQASFTENGALVVAFFSGKASWVVGSASESPAGDAVVSRSTGVLRKDAAEVPGSYEIREAAPDAPEVEDVDILDLANWQWEWVPAGSSANLVGPGQHARTWH